MSVILETVILSTFLMLASGDYLMIFRGKSKHTSLITPFGHWILPEYEVKSSFGCSFDENYYFDPDPLLIGKGNTFRRLKARSNDSPPNSATILENAESEGDLLYACQKCILLHGIFEIWGEGYSVEEVASKFEMSVQYQTLLEAHGKKNGRVSSESLLSINVAASILEQPWLSTEQLKADILSKFDYLWQNLNSDHGRDNLATSRKIKLIGDKEPPVEDSASLKQEGCKSAAAGSTVDLRIYLDETSGYCVLCKLLAKGLAAPSNSGTEAGLIRCRVFCFRVVSSASLCEWLDNLHAHLTPMTGTLNSSPLLAPALLSPTSILLCSPLAHITPLPLPTLLSPTSILRFSSLLSPTSVRLIE